MKETTSPNKNCESWLGGEGQTNTFHNDNQEQNLPTEPHFNHAMRNAWPKGGAVMKLNLKINLKKIKTKYKKTSINMGNLKHSQVANGQWALFLKSKHLLQIHTCVVAVFL